MERNKVDTIRKIVEVYKMRNVYNVKKKIIISGR